MGHIRLGRLPDTKKWNRVVDLLRSNAPLSLIAKFSMEASAVDFVNAINDPTLNYSFWLLTKLPIAARSDDFANELKGLRIDVGENPSLPEITAAITDHLDAYNRQIGHRSDIGEMAQLAAVESITRLVGEKLPSLFEATSQDIQDSFRAFAKSQEFAHLGHEFFARFTHRYLYYYLSRELSNHVGPKQRFTTIENHSNFSRNFQSYCRKVSQSLLQSAGGWFGKETFSGGIDLEKSRRFVAIALNNIRKELSAGGGVR